MVSGEATGPVPTRRIATVVRWVLAVLFLMTGVMKLAIPMLGEAFSGQLTAANIPFHTLSRWSVPVIEVVVGILLALNAFTRFVTIVVIGIMAVATYVHLVVDEPALFPLQPTQPVIPIIVILMSLYLTWEIVRSDDS